MIERIYSAPGIKVRWQSDLCSHCEACWRGLPQVFNPEHRPWVNIDGATAEKIRQQVDQCPTGALSVLVIEARQQ